MSPVKYIIKEPSAEAHAVQKQTSISAQTSSTNEERPLCLKRSSCRHLDRNQSPLLGRIRQWLRVRRSNSCYVLKVSLLNRYYVRKSFIRSTRVKLKPKASTSKLSLISRWMVRRIFDFWKPYWIIAQRYKACFALQPDFKRNTCIVDPSGFTRISRPAPVPQWAAFKGCSVHLFVCPLATRFYYPIVFITY